MDCRQPNSLLNMNITPLCNHRSMLGEGPVWDAANHTILWVDIMGCAIHELNMKSNALRSISTPSMIGSFALCTDGNILAAMQDGFIFIDRITGAVSPLSDPEAAFPDNRFNDGKTDPAGRFWAGSMSLSGEKGTGNLYMVDQQLNVKKQIENVSISNGLCWSLDQRSFYYIDTPTMEVVCYDYDNQTGEITNKTTVITIPAKEGYPDGMTIDSEGMLWIAHWEGWQVARWDPSTGNKIDSIHLPVSLVTSICFGGENMDDMFITSARVGLTDEQLAEEPLAGSSFIISKTGFKGFTFPAFNLSQQ
jgi:sugar lactone lactonase YvrE